jgi:hypothetical protein
MANVKATMFQTNKRLNFSKHRQPTTKQLRTSWQKHYKKKAVIELPIAT